MREHKVEKVEITERGLDVVFRVDTGAAIRFEHVKVDAEWLLGDSFARALDRAARRVHAREAETDPLCCDVAMF